ncbi:DUF4065 domain-containing protein [Cytophagaceae bacterium DM2B3-1]|uniref:DUF4065 domain-containing protein n=1 Tax=Xanthocytophaga flava TaxID=3048013 RepID=A0ABT7CXF7_9BACT|nr:type II toxin-antitoxin system antitoxin SocA domain-containing protein [Xanthocytophaga flavus]MDJ1470923.1 DUF4065 domain-containing protein [Xanthocytophaga flavus]MDJ1498186.1 DUF4065 domain-containing protein [Xanthocytophaga flavus]
MYSSAAIANYFLAKGKADNKPLSPMKLQKLMYFAYGWYLATTNQRLFNEMIEAWRYGPVIPSVYEAFRHFGNSNITEPMPDFNTPVAKSGINDETAQQILDVVWYVYSDLSAIALSNLTHEKGTPWYKIYEQYGSVKNIPSNKDINEEYIKEYFVQKLNSLGNKEAH